MEKGFKEMINAIPGDLIPGLEQIKQKFISKFAEISNSALDQQVDLYDQLFSEEVIDASTAFFASPEGQQIIAALPKLAQGMADQCSATVNKLMQEMIKDLIDMDLTEEQMESMGFFKIPTDEIEGFLSELLPKRAPIEDETPPSKPSIKVEEDVTAESLDEFAKRWLDKKE